MGYDVTFLTTVYRDREKLERDLEKERIELLSVEVAWFVEENVSRHVAPSMVPEESPGVVLDTYVLISQTQGEVADLGDLKGKSILYMEHQDANLAKIWLDVMLMDRGLAPTEAYTSSARQVHKASAAILPVFFGKKDACVVDRSSFELMVELNPQIGIKLRIIAESPPVLDTVLCLNPSGSLTPDQESNLHRALLTLQDYPQGEQILTMFGIAGFVPFREEYLSSAREILRKHASHRANGSDRIELNP